MIGPAATFRKIVAERCAQLQARPFADLERLARPRFGPVGENLMVGSRSGTILTLVDVRDNGALRVVLWGKLPGRFLWFVSDMAMEGFYKHADGAVTPMSDREFDEFD